MKEAPFTSPELRLVRVLFSHLIYSPGIHEVFGVNIVTITVSFFSSEVDYFITQQKPATKPPTSPASPTSPIQPLSTVRSPQKQETKTYQNLPFFFKIKLSPCYHCFFFPIPEMFKHQPTMSHHVTTILGLVNLVPIKRKVLALISGQWFALSLWLPTCFAVGRAQ